MQSPNNRREKQLKDSEERKIRSSLLILDLKIVSCRIRERKKKARFSINCNVNRDKKIGRRGRGSILVKK